MIDKVEPTPVATLERLSAYIKTLPEQRLRLEVEAREEKIEQGSASFEDFDLYVVCRQEMQLRLKHRTTAFPKYRASA